MGTLNKSRTFKLMAGLVLLLCGCAIYLLFRSKTIYLYQWFASAGLADAIDVLRQRVSQWPLPDFFRYSLPDGLYCVSYMCTMDALWPEKGWQRTVMVILIPVVAAVHELLQAVGVVRGTADVADLLCYVVPPLIFTVYTLFINKHC